MMINWFRDILFSESDQDPRFITLVRTILSISIFAAIAITISLIVVASDTADWVTIGIVGAITVLSSILLALTYKKILWPGKLFLPLAMLLAVPFIATQANGLHDSSISLFPVIIVVATLLIGQKIIPLITILTLIGIWTVAYYDMAGLNNSIIASRTAIDDIAVISLGQIIAAGALNGLMTRMNSTLTQSRKNEQAQTIANQELRELQASLEEHIGERTAELAESAKQLQKRAEQFETIAQLARTINTIQDPETLLHKITQLISSSFGFYHVGLFLLDESRQYAVLSAANSEGGEQMLARKHRLKVGSQGIVGYVTSSGSPRIALDTGTDTVFFNNPDLPATRSEMALPLRAGKVIIGALDVQSTEPNAFVEEDVEVLSILADVVSVAIENARLFEESRQVLMEAQVAYSESTFEAWKKLTTNRETFGYTLYGPSIRPLEKPLNRAEIREAIETGKMSISTTGKNKKAVALAVPIKLRDQVIGTININLPEDREWDSDEIDIAQALAERVGVAVENATLLDESRRRAARESLVGSISAKISTTTEVERIMQVAVGELQQALGASEVSLRLSNENTISE